MTTRALPRALFIAAPALLCAAGCGAADGPISEPSLVCAATSEDPSACNGSPALCARRYNEISYPTTHNAMSNRDAGWGAPNQEHGITRQLEDGVRGLMLDVHDYTDPEDPADTRPYLCHALCELGKQPLEEGLAEIRAFLDCHPREVVTIIFESYVSAASIAHAFEKSDLVRYARAQPLGEPWPTLGELIGEDERLIVFTDYDPGAPGWYMDQWAYAWQNPYAAKTAADFSCDVDRGSGDSSVFIMNHFLTDPLASAELADQVNHNPLLYERARQCETEAGQLPNFVTVDFYTIGDLFSAVRSLNGLSP